MGNDCCKNANPNNVSNPRAYVVNDPPRTEAPAPQRPRAANNVIMEVSMDVNSKYSVFFETISNLTGFSTIFRG